MDILPSIYRRTPSVALLYSEPKEENEREKEKGKREGKKDNKENRKKENKSKEVKDDFYY